MQVQNAVLLVTGAASGLGRACVERLVKSGARVMAVDRRWEHTDPDIPAEQIRYEAADVSSADEVAGVVQQTAADFGQLHGVINCAGILHAGRVVSRQGIYSLADFTDVIRVNLIGTFNVIRLAAELMIKNAPGDHGERGVIINTSSVAAFDGQTGQAAYSASKGGVAAMTLPLAREFAEHGIRVVAIAPGVFETPMMTAMPERVRQSLLDQTLFPKRLGEPAEFAALVQHVLENVMLNGSVLRLDGGMRMQAR